MGKFPFKRPRIISKKFPEMDNHIDAVRKSLESLVFSYSHHVDKTLQRKHLLMMISSLVLLVVLGSFFSPKGKADSSIFYPEVCLGGWANPHNAEGEPQTSSNGDKSSFTDKNSAILSKDINADIYCSSFKGKFDQATKPKKIVVTLAISQGGDVSESLLDYATSSATGTESVASSSLDAAQVASGTLKLATSTDSAGMTVATSTGETSTTTAISTGTTTDAQPQEDIATSSVPTPVTEQASTVIDGIIESIKDTVNDISNLTKTEPQTDTVVVPPPPSDATQDATPTTDAPTSFIDTLFHSLALNIATEVFAQEGTDTTATTDTAVSDTATPQAEETSTQAEQQPADTTGGNTASTAADQSTKGGSGSDITSTTSDTVSPESASTSTDDATTTALDASSTIIANNPITLATTTEDASDTDNNFLEVSYTFDGRTWEPLGELNDISMKYRTFEIPVTSSTSWNDMSELQIKITSKKHEMNRKTIYLDAVAVEVFFETVVLHEHPDFSHDTILDDKTSDGVRVINLINGDNNMPQVWYTAVDDQSDIGVSPGSWIESNLHDIATTYRVVGLFGQNMFWVDEDQKMLWVTNLKKQSNDGTAYVDDGTTTVPFTKGDDTLWYADYVTSSTTKDMIYFRKAPTDGN